MSDHQNSVPDHPEMLLSRTARVSSIPKKGQHVIIRLSDEEKQAIAAFYSLQDIPAFEAKILLEKVTSTKVHMTGVVTADVIQSCVHSLAPVPTRVEEEIDLTLVPQDAPTRSHRPISEEPVLVLGLEDDMPDLYDQDTIEVGALTLEHFCLGLQPYPQAAGADFRSLHQLKDDKEPSPFAGLAALRDKLKPE